MRRKLGWFIGGLGMCALLATLAPAQAGGVNDFKLANAVPADAMIAVHARSHAGMDFVNHQHARVWEAVQQQGFDRDLRRLIRGALEDAEQDVDAFDTQWQQITDLASTVAWEGLAGQEFTFAMKLAVPFGADFVYLTIPTAGQMDTDFQGLTALLKHLVDMAPENVFVLTTEGAGNSVVHTVMLAAPVVPIKLTLARHEDVLLFGVGITMADQCLALLRGESDPATASLKATPRFSSAVNRLPTPEDAVYFIDVGALMRVANQFADLGVAAVAAEMPTSMPAGETPPANPMEMLPKLIKVLDVWDYVAGVSTTKEKQTRTEEITVLRPDATSRPLYRILYGGGVLRDPLKYIPKDAAGVNVMSGFDLAALHDETIAFIKAHAPDGELMIAQYEALQQQLELNIEEDVVDWLGNSFATFSAPIPTPFLPGWVLILEVKDEQKANAAMDGLAAWLNTVLADQQGGVEDARLDAAPGFRRVILPPIAAMIPGLGAPIFGVKDGRLFFGNGPEIVTASLEAGSGARPNFTENERFKNEGLPLESNMVTFSFQDLSKLGEQLGQMLPAIAFMARMNPEVSQNPVASAILNVLTKVGNVCKTLDFFQSSCTVSTFDGQVAYMKSVTNYQEPPKSKPPASPTEPPAASGGS